VDGLAHAISSDVRCGHPTRLYGAFSEHALASDGFTSYHVENLSRQAGRDAVVALWGDGKIPSAETFLDLNRVHALIVRGSQRYFPEAASLLASWVPFFNCRLNSNLYITRPGCSAFGTHYDQHHVFALQLDGEKEWTLWEPTVDAPHGRYRFDEAPPVGEPLTWTSRPGDVLYIPLGWVHKARTVGAVSVHLTIGVNPPRWLDLIEQVVDELAGEVSLLRRSLPFRFSADDGMVFLADPVQHVEPIIALLTNAFAERTQRILDKSRSDANDPRRQ
jgi:ribosomal protein L16 Arg81 hydroxylase